MLEILVWALQTSFTNDYEGWKWMAKKPTVLL